MTKQDVIAAFQVRRVITAPTEKSYRVLIAIRAELTLEHPGKSFANVVKGYVDGRCKNCGISGHSIDDCGLKKQGDKELAEEARRRALRNRPLPVRPVPEVAKKRRLKLAWLTEAK